MNIIVILSHLNSNWQAHGQGETADELLIRIKSGLVGKSFSSAAKPDVYTEPIYTVGAKSNVTSEVVKYYLDKVDAMGNSNDTFRSQVSVANYEFEYPAIEQQNSDLRSERQKVYERYKNTARIEEYPKGSINQAN